MEEILNLLKERNTFLRQFYSINRTEMFRFEEGDFSRIEYFYKSRDNILDMISHLESELDGRLGVLEAGDDVPPDLKTQVRTELDFKDDVITQILDQDLEILAKIDGAKNKIIKELQEVAKVKNGLSGYHSEGATKKPKRTPRGI
jgi:hypothetical protein